MEVSAPILISCMTGGTPRTKRVNKLLARVAQTFKIALGIGSARALLEDPECLSSFDVRDDAPDVPFLVNLGAVQLNYGVGIADCCRLVSVLRANALVIHLNPLQEALQLAGNTNYSGLLRKIISLRDALDVPLIVKEVGWGLDAESIRTLESYGVSFFDIAGAGGTSWSEVERHRSTGSRAITAGSFRSWGIPSAVALVEARRVSPTSVIIASGGICDGHDIAKAIALGADIAGIARPFVLTASKSEEGTMEYAESLLQTLRTIMFALGVSSIDALRGTSRLAEVGSRFGSRVSKTVP